MTVSCGCLPAAKKMRPLKSGAAQQAETAAKSRVVRWKGWIAVFSALTLTIALLTWNGWISFLPVIGTIAGTIGYWTNNAKKIRLANLVANSPCMLAYDALVGSWGGVLNESVIMISIVISILRFGWNSMDGDKIGEK